MYINRYFEFIRSRQSSLYKWNLIICEGELQNKISSEEGFYADPFILDSKNILCEFFSYKLNRGLINHIEKINDMWVDRGAVFDNNVHASYPFIFEFNNILYCMPEQCQLKKLVMYPIVNKNHIISLDTQNYILIQDDANIVDANILLIDNVYFVFYNIDLINSGDPGNILCCKKLKNLDKNSWNSVSAKVLVTDVRKSRNGGKIFYDPSSKQIVRFFQKKINFEYGNGLDFEVYDLDLNICLNYEFNLLSKYMTQVKEFCAHHLDFNNNIFVFDNRKVV